jgi:type IV secretory pathway TrbL component
MGFGLRVILWMSALAYEGVLLSIGMSLVSLGQVVTMAFFGAISGFLLAALFTIRQCRREKRHLRTSD